MSRPWSRIRAGLAAAVLVLLAAAGGAWAADPRAADGDPFRGREVFHDKGCSRCHSVWGHGGTLGPEITVAVAGKTWDELVGDFWNHTPRMIDEGNERGYPWPTLERGEMADILSYLYYLRLFDEPGDPVRGADTYARLQCGGCHALGGRGGRLGRALDRFGAYPSPAPLAQAMWNAGPLMQQAQRQAGPIPQFTGHEMADLQAYVRAEGRRPGREVKLQPLPSPVRGAVVYRGKRCGACHGQAAGRAPDITRSALSRTASEIAGLLWNHSYAMGAEMAARGVPFPRFEGNELSDLIAYLYFRGYLGEDGDPRRGLVVFKAKGCVGCHAGGVEGAPDLAKALRQTDRAGLASAMWNHAPQMHELMAAKAPFWPKFEPGEMRNLVAYLRSLSRPSERRPSDARLEDP
jgi:mono/diheme cytochrome c family protein